MLSNLMELLINFTEGMLFYYIISHCLSMRYCGIRKYLCILGDFIVITTCNLFVGSITASIFIILLSEVIMTIVFTKNSLSEKVFWGCSMSVISIISEKISILLITYMAESHLDMIYEVSYVRYGTAFLYLLLSAIFAFFIVHIKGHSLLFPIPIMILFLTLVITGIVVTDTLIFYIVKLEDSSVNIDKQALFSLYLVGFSFLFILLFIFVLIAIVGNLYKKNLALQRIKEQRKLEKAQFELLDSSNKTLRAWKHDHVNHLQTIQQLVGMQQITECKEYLSQLITMIHTDTQGMYTGNPAVDAILAVKRQEAKEAGIAFECELYLPKHASMPLNPVEFSSVVGNLLNNAMEASVATKEAFVRLSMKTVKSTLFITVENSSRGKYTYGSKGEFLSTKEEQGHGLGLKRVETLINGAGGFCKINPQNDRFEVSIMLPLRDRQALAEI